MQKWTDYVLFKRKIYRITDFASGCTNYIKFEYFLKSPRATLSLHLKNTTLEISVYPKKYCLLFIYKRNLWKLRNLQKSIRLLRYIKINTTFEIYNI